MAEHREAHFGELADEVCLLAQDRLRLAVENGRVEGEVDRRGHFGGEACGEAVAVGGLTGHHEGVVHRGVAEATVCDALSGLGIEGGPRRVIRLHAGREKAEGRYSDNLTFHLGPSFLVSRLWLSPARSRRSR